MIVVVLSPHRDDAAFSLGLSIDTWLAQGHTVSVLNVFTQSEYAPYSDADALHPNDRVSFVSALRKREDQAWNKLTGNRLSFHDLDLLDAPLRLACAVDEVLTAEIRPGDRALVRVEGAIAKLASRAGQGSLCVIAPLAVGGHIDHRVVHEAALRVQAGKPMPLAFYEDLPYSAREGEAAMLEDFARKAMPEAQPVFALDQGPDPTSATERKTRLAESYDSQVDSEVIRSMAEFACRYDGRERLWANQAWIEAMRGGREESRA